jgi:TetR/AcrR family transcriptional repressor of uid operon
MVTATRKPSSDRILEAAERVFVKHGYGETSLRQVMASSRISTTAFYARFASKEAVLRELVVRLIAELDTRARAELSTATGLEDGFTRGMDVLVGALAEKRGVVRLALTEAAVSPIVNETVGRAYQKLVGLLAWKIDALVKRGIIAELDVDAAAWALVGAVSIHVQRWAVWEEIETEELASTLRRAATALTPVLTPLATGKRGQAKKGKSE